MSGVAMVLRFLIPSFLGAVAWCQEVITVPMHEPLYPAADEDVRYSLTVEATHPISRIRLEERPWVVDSTGVRAMDAPSVWQWAPEDAPTSYEVSQVKLGGNGSNRLIRYSFIVELVGGSRFTHEITYAVRPYPVLNDGLHVPAPVYAQGDPRYSIDLVFVPDTDITDEAAFRDHCSKMITDAMWLEPTLAARKRSFNYYINPRPGTAVDHADPQVSHHEPPTNDNNLSFAEAKVLMHEADLTDYWRHTKHMFSTEVDSRWTMLHELGHAVFGLADEHFRGKHFEPSCAPCPQNNWPSRARAEDDVGNYPGMTEADVQSIEIASGVHWHKICEDFCQMDIARDGDDTVAASFDLPCIGRIKRLFNLLILEAIQDIAPVRARLMW